MGTELEQAVAVAAADNADTVRGGNLSTLLSVLVNFTLVFVMTPALLLLLAWTLLRAF